MSKAIDRLAFQAGPVIQKGDTLLDLQFESSLNLKYAFILRILETLGANWSISPEEQKKIELCLDEAIQNAIVWGNKQDPNKKVRIHLWNEEGRWCLSVSDEGDGFTRDELPDYESEEFLWQDHGRGVFILLNYLNEVSYHDGGRTLVLKS